MKRYNCRIVDSKKPLNIRIKLEDTKNAVCRDHQKCVVARAIKRQTGAKWVDVGANTVLIETSKKTAKRFFLPLTAKDQVRYFDENKGAFAPCKVELKVPYKSKLHNQGPLGMRKGKNSRSGNSSKSKMRRKPSR